MILKRLTLTNFRQFRGTQAIDFAHGKANVTIIYGENGRGKTGIFRAIMFCLYGDRVLSQDGDTARDEIQLVNTAALNETDGPVDTSVELSFDHDDIGYTLYRSIRGLLDNESIIEEPDVVRLALQLPDGNTTIQTDPKEIALTVSSVLDKRVREYFLFDGEKMERLTRATEQQRREVSKGVRNLLNIDALEIAMKAVSKLRSNLFNELAGKATGEHKKVLHRLSTVDDELVLAKDALPRLEDEIALATDELHDIDRKLEGYDEIADLLEKEKKLNDLLEDNEDSLVGIRSEIRERSASCAVLLVTSCIDDTFEHIDAKKKKGQIPDELRRSLIEKILEEKRCICGKDIIQGTSEYDAIKDWLEKSGDPDMQDDMLDIWRYLGGIVSKRDSISRDAEGLLQRHAKTAQDIDRLRRELAATTDAIGTGVRSDSADLSVMRKNIKKSLIDMEAKKQLCIGKCNELEAERKKLYEQNKALEREEGLRSELAQRSELAAETLDALREVYDDFTNDARKAISKDASDTLAKFLDSDSKHLFSGVIVNNDYSLQISDRWGNPFLANISAGQRQLMSISFIAALAKTASGGSLLEKPLFMDTPFARLSFEHRKNLIHHLPDLCAQWILLTTDTELRKQEGKLFTQHGRLGSFYLLISDDNGDTQVENREVKDVSGILHESEEDLL